MRKLWAVVALMILLVGCASQDTMETVSDEAVIAMATVRNIRVELPEETVMPVMETDTGEIYICRDFEVSLQTLPGGDLDRTVETLTGFGVEDVTVMQTGDRYDLIWSCAGELGTEVGRARILSDGGYHYCLTAQASEENAEECRAMLSGMFESFGLE